MPLPTSTLPSSAIPTFTVPTAALPPSALVPDSLAAVVAAVLVPLALASLVYVDAHRRRRSARSCGASLAPLAWGATTFFSGVGCFVVAACYAVVRSR